KAADKTSHHAVTVRHATFLASILRAAAASPHGRSLAKSISISPLPGMRIIHCSPKRRDPFELGRRASYRLQAGDSNRTGDTTIIVSAQRMTFNIFGTRQICPPALDSCSTVSAYDPSGRLSVLAVRINMAV